MSAPVNASPPDAGSECATTGALAGGVTTLLLGAEQPV
jgi:hypothetical protein